MRGRIFAVIAAVSLLVGCDHTTKHLAETSLRYSGPKVLVPGVLDLSYVQNHDVAFNLLSWMPTTWRAPLLLAIGVLAVVGLVVWLAKRRSAPPLQAVAVAQILSGALGNTADRLLRGYVVDFIHVHRWPVFNVADIAVVVGVILLLIGPKITEWRSRAAPTPS